METTTRTFEFSLDLDQMIAVREVCASGRALSALLSDAQWQAYRVRVRDVLGKKFPDGTRYAREVFIAVGHKG
ncbi:hypothetical protein D3C83_187970 [compost metagenome]